jgi:acetyl esterase/lipase
MRSLVSLLTGLALVSCLANSLSAQAPSLAERFERIDRDGDGRITPRELPRETLFKRLDRNGDGVIEKTELPGRNKRRPQPSAKTERKTPAMPREPAHTAHRDIPYAQLDDVDPSLLSLDLYVPKGKAPPDGRPVLVMIHGGGWRRGDKSNRATVGAKMRHFVGNGYIYATVDYRLSRMACGGDGVEHPVHAQDCAKALAWVNDHIDDYGGDPERIHVAGTRACREFSRQVHQRHLRQRSDVGVLPEAREERG